MAHVEPTSSDAGPALSIMAIEVVYCPAGGDADTVSVRLPPGAMAVDALQASGVLMRHGLPLPALRVGIWSRPCALDTPLRDRDRVEIYRPLAVDPKDARRRRDAQQQQAKASTHRSRGG